FVVFTCAGDSRFSPARGDSRFSPARGDSRFSPARGDSRFSPARGDSGFHLRAVTRGFHLLAGDSGFHLFADSLGFCQLFLDCPLETCLRRNGRRPQALPSETIRLMDTRLERPDAGTHAWERRSLTVEGPACSAEASLEVTDLLLTALENPVKYVEENMEQKMNKFFLPT
uniref:Uncharacterized protein n=1 Tax=Oryctolagus cuniculus TaxID=9986 RepID=G1SVS8_RABIT